MRMGRVLLGAVIARDVGLHEMHFHEDVLHVRIGAHLRQHRQRAAVRVQDRCGGRLPEIQQAIVVIVVDGRAIDHGRPREAVRAARLGQRTRLDAAQRGVDSHGEGRVIPVGARGPRQGVAPRGVVVEEGLVLPGLAAADDVRDLALRVDVVRLVEAFDVQGEAGRAVGHRIRAVVEDDRTVRQRGVAIDDDQAGAERRGATRVRQPHPVRTRAGCGRRGAVARGLARLRVDFEETEHVRAIRVGEVARPAAAAGAAAAAPAGRAADAKLLAEEDLDVAGEAERLTVELHPARARFRIVQVADDLPVEEGRRDVDALGHTAEPLRVALGAHRDGDVAGGETAAARAAQADALHGVVAGEKVVLEEVEGLRGLGLEVRGDLRR